MVCVVGSSGKPMMPTTEARARKLLKRRRAEILKYRPFIIGLLDREDGDVQPIEYKCDSVPRRHVIDGGAEGSGVFVGPSGGERQAYRSNHLCVA